MREHIDPDPNPRSGTSSLSFDNESDMNLPTNTGNVMTAQSSREYTEVHESPRQDDSQYAPREEINRNPTTVAKHDKKVNFPQTNVVNYPVATVDSTTDVEGVKTTTTPIKPKSPTIPGPGLLPQPNNQNTQTGTISTFPRCGLKVDAADTKMIPTQKVWALFAILFCFGCWTCSWIPFMCKKCYDPVEICPHCFRRLHRKPVGSDSAYVT